MTKHRLDARAFAEDVANAVCDYCADGIDAFEKCLQGAPLLEPGVIHEIQMGTERLGQDLVDCMESNLTLFQQLCTMAVFNVPDHIMLEQDPMPLVSPMRTPVKSEQELDALLQDLRMQLQQAGAERTQLQAEIFCLDQDIKQHGHLAGHTAALASTLQLPTTPLRSAPAGLDQLAPGPAPAASVPDIAASIAAISAGMHKLQPLLQKAHKLRAQRLPLAAIQDAAVAVEVKSTHMSKACGTLQDLQALKYMLNPQAKEQHMGP